MKKQKRHSTLGLRQLLTQFLPGPLVDSSRTAASQGVGKYNWQNGFGQLVKLTSRKSAAYQNIIANIGPLTRFYYIHLVIFL